MQWPGRFEVLRRHPTVILDGAHNAHGMRATVESLRQMFPGQRVTLILGILEDKDVEQMLDLLTPVAGTAFVIRPESPRAMAPEALCARLECRGVTAYPCPDVQAAVDAALRTAGKTGAVCALGSLYSAAAVRQAVQQDGACP
ncbi:MAG: cyanophycin synthetase [Dysosmobacter sp.]